MRIRPSVLAGLGIGVVFIGAIRTLEAMGVENTIWVCILAAIVATYLMGSISQ